MEPHAVEKRTVSWSSPSVTNFGLSTHATHLRIPGLPNITCLFVCQMTRQLQGPDNVQVFWFELIWEDSANVHLFYACEFLVSHSVNNWASSTVIWRHDGTNGAIVSSRDRFPKCKGETRCQIGELRLSLRVEFDVYRSGFRSPPTPMTKISAPLFEEGTFSDVVVVCGEKTFNCHKVILAGSSEVFKAMLTAPFKEASENRIELKSMTEDVAELVLKFIYTDEVPEGSNTWSLFEAAKMYDLPKLMHICIATMGKNLTVGNACEMLLQAHMHDLNQLFDYVLGFIKRNKAEVAATSGWKDVTGNSEIIAKLILAIL